MTLVAFGLFVALVLTVVLGWRYIDSVRDERYSDAYELGWANGYDVGKRDQPMHSENEVEKAYQEGYNQGRDDLIKNAQSRSKKPVKKVKKITSKEN